MYKENSKENTIVTTPSDSQLETNNLSIGNDVLTDMYIRRLQRTVFVLSGMDDSDEYVHIIGTGREESNFAAIGTLITNLLDTLTETSTNQHLEKVMDELSDRFHDLRYLVTLH